jgi:hypothetical protein
MGPKLNGFAGGPGSYEATTYGKALLLVFRFKYRITILSNQKIDSNIVLRYCEPAAAYSRFIEAVNRHSGFSGVWNSTLALAVAVF